MLRRRCCPKRNVVRRRWVSRITNGINLSLKNATNSSGLCRSVSSRQAFPSPAWKTFQSFFYRHSSVQFHCASEYGFSVRKAPLTHCTFASQTRLSILRYTYTLISTLSGAHSPSYCAAFGIEPGRHRLNFVSYGHRKTLVVEKPGELRVVEAGQMIDRHFTKRV